MAKKKDVIISPKEEYAYGHIINALAGGLYPNKFHVIREYIQNGFDAIATLRRTREAVPCSIKISIQRPSILIYDNGTGMDRHTINEYRKVGFSKKMVGEYAGFRGIGKLAGISVAKKLVVVTSACGVGEKYTLTFNAQGMLQEIRDLKETRQNISLNSLVEKYTELTSDVEDPEEHYTAVELQHVRPDSKVLFDMGLLTEYISRNGPVPFNPEFASAQDIQDDIKQFVEDYECVEITIDGKTVFKPFVPELKPHQHIVVWGGENRKQRKAFCWYCENIRKGQIKPNDIGGLVYRYKNFAVGDNYLTRKTIWRNSAHLAFYFMGEVYVTDPNIVPTSQRDDFEQNEARDEFYEDARVIANELSGIARDSSGVRRAEEYVTRGADLVSAIGKEIQKKEPYLGDLSIEKIAQLSNVISNIEKRKKNIRPKDKRTSTKATKVVNRAKKLLGEFDKVRKASSSEFNIVKQLGLGKEAKEVYATTIRTLKDLFVDRPEELEQIIKTLQRNLSKAFKARRKK